MQSIISILLIIGSFLLFFLYSNPSYEATTDLKNEISNYDAALDNAEQLRVIRDEQTANYRKISREAQTDLEKLVPDTVDNIKLIIDIDRIAQRYGLEVKDIKIDQSQDGAKTAQGTRIAASGEPTGMLNLSFGVTASYENILLFLKDLERSLRIVDIVGFSFSSDTANSYDFEISFKTYWLK